MKTTSTSVKTTSLKKSNVTTIVTKKITTTELTPRRYVKKAESADYWNSKSTHKQNKVSKNKPANFSKVMRSMKMSSDAYVLKHFELVQLLIQNDLKVSKVYRASKKSIYTIHKVKCAILDQQSKNFS